MQETHKLRWHGRLATRFRRVLAQATGLIAVGRITLCVFLSTSRLSFEKFRHRDNPKTLFALHAG
jgi:hypothetical protein